MTIPQHREHIGNLDPATYVFLVSSSLLGIFDSSEWMYFITPVENLLAFGASCYLPVSSNQSP